MVKEKVTRIFVEPEGVQVEQKGEDLTENGKKLQVAIMALLKDYFIRFPKTSSFTVLQDHLHGILEIRITLIKQK